jgi:hypothetical protein
MKRNKNRFPFCDWELVQNRLILLKLVLENSEKLANEIKFCNGEGRDTAEEIEKKRGKEKVGKKIWHGKKIKI